MQTSFTVNPEIAVEGMPQGGARASRPATLPQLPQIATLLVTGGSETDDLVVVIVDDATQQSYTFTATGSATEATLATNVDTAFAAHPKLSDLFTLDATSATDVDLEFTARHSNRAYTITATGGTSSSTAPATTIDQVAGGDGVEFGLLVERGPGDDEFDAPDASTVLADVLGALFRTEANHFHALENDTPTDVDAAERGRTYGIMREGNLWVKVEDAVDPSSTPYMRRAATSGAGRPGALRATPAGGQQLLTATPAAVDLDGYGFSFGYLGQHYAARYFGDGTTTVAVACDGLALSLGTIAGLTITDATTAVTVETAAGTELDYFSEDLSQDDTAAASVDLVETTAADVDAIDVSSICNFETTAAADGFALLRMKA